jgi:hypothetical protein
VDLREMVWEVVDWIHLAQDRDQWRTLVNTIMIGDFLTGWVTISFSRRTLLHGVT